MLIKVFPFMIIIIFLALSFVPHVNADQISLVSKIRYVPEIEKALQQGLKSYNAKDYEKSLALFEKLASFKPVHQRISISQFMLGKSLIKVGRLGDAIMEFRELMAEYPQSRYVEHCHYEMGSCFYLMNNPLAAAREFVWLIDYGRTPELQDKAVQIASFLIPNNLTLAEVKLLTSEFTGRKSASFLTHQLVDKQVGLGQVNEAVNTIVDFLNENPRSESAPALENTLNKLKMKIGSKLKIGVLLPVTSGYTEDGVGILRGITFALKQFEEKSNQKVELVVKNSGSNVVSAIKAAQTLTEDDNIIAVIGELESEITAAIGATLLPCNLPLIAPLASQNGLASIGDNIFQANSDLYQRGKQLATYVIEDLKMKTFATLAPADAYGQEMTEGFVTTVEKLGGSIVSPPKWYFQGSKNLGRQLRSIYTSGLKIMKEDTAWARRHPHVMSHAVSDSFVVSVTSIDGLFCPVYTEEIKILGPQCKNINLRTRFLGGDYWFDQETLRTCQSYIDSVVFVSDFYINEFKPEYRKLRTDFRIKMGHDFDRMEIFGYDAMKVLLETIQANSITSRQKLIEKLQAIQNFAGVKGTVTWLGNQRVNKDVSILQYRQGSIQKIR